MLNHLGSQTFLYLHGLGSHGESTTAQALRSAGIAILSPTYRAEHYLTSISQLMDMIVSNSIQGVIGTSMGGFYALKLAEMTQLPVIAVNPCFEPIIFFEQYAHYPIIDYTTNQSIFITEADIGAFDPLDATKIHNPNIIIGKNDQVIPADYQRAFCQRHGWSCMETDWGHRVEDVSLILSLINAD